MNQQEISERAHKLIKERQILFCVHLAKRLWPNYIFFIKKEGFGDVNFLDSLLENVKKYITQSNGNLNWDKLKSQIFEITPDSEEFSSLYTSYAADACGACYDLIALIVENDLEAINRIIDSSINSVYLCILNKLNLPSVSNSHPDDKIYNSQEMKNEVNFQKKLLIRIEEGVISELIDEAFDVVYLSNIGLDN